MGGESWGDIAENLAWNIKQRLEEASYDQLVKKQDDITNLFPQFDDRVKAVAKRGGVDMISMSPAKWEFTIQSGTYDASKPELMKKQKHPKEYDAIINFSNLVDMIKNIAVKEKAVWNDRHDKLNLQKLSRAIFYDSNLQIYCSCPADLYWGGHYIRTKHKDAKGSKYTAPETRPPNIRNPKQHGAFCKHLQVLMDSLPFYISTMATFLKRHYMKEITAIENQVTGAKKEAPKKGEPEKKDMRKYDVKPAAQLLKQKEEEVKKGKEKEADKSQQQFKRKSV